MITGFDHQVQLSVLIKAVGMGYLLGMFFSFLNFTNVSFGKSTVSVCLRDVLFFTVSAFTCFLFSLKYCSGMLRFYVAAGELMGFIIWRIFPGELISGLWKSLCERICGVTKKLFKCTKKISKKLKFFTKNT